MKYLADEFNNFPYKKHANEAQKKCTKDSGFHAILKLLSFCTL